jgi:large conductance mechanosensitive channel
VLFKARLARQPGHGVPPWQQPLPKQATKEHSMGMMQEFKEFAVKGNVVDLAVGVIIGAAFGKIVDSVVGDLIMPVVGAVIGKLDFSSLFVVLGSVPAGTATTLDALKKAGVPVFAYGSFITVAVNFVILAFIIFLMIKQVNRLKKSAPAAPTAPAATPEDVVLLREIRDSLKNR